MKHTKQKKLDRVVVLVPQRNLLNDEETDELNQLIRQAVDDGNRCLVINLEKVELINSAALGWLIAAHVTYSKRDGRAVICRLDTKVRNLFVMTKLINVFDVYETEEQAVASFAGQAASS